MARRQPRVLLSRGDAHLRARRDRRPRGIRPPGIRRGAGAIPGAARRADRGPLARAAVRRLRRPVRLVLLPARGAYACHRLGVPFVVVQKETTIAPWNMEKGSRRAARARAAGGGPHDRLQRPPPRLLGEGRRSARGDDRHRAAPLRLLRAGAAGAAALRRRRADRPLLHLPARLLPPADGQVGGRGRMDGHAQADRGGPLAARRGGLPGARQAASAAALPGRDAADPERGRVAVRPQRLRDRARRATCGA